LADYIGNLRRNVGHRPLLLCGVKVLLIDGSDRILLQIKQDHDLWGIPGGMVELGEKIEDTAVREVLKETGFRVTEMELFGVFSGEEQYYQYPNGDEVYYVTIVYASRKYGGNIKDDGDECKDLRFFGYDNLPASINPLDWPIINGFFRYTG
jgi:ADP-ribose pyrophosphatase YjhB (NUDIX family)